MKMNAKFVILAACIAAVAQFASAQVSCDSFQSTSLTIGLPLAPVSAKLACELHCTGRGGAVDVCAALIGGNCACLEALSDDNGKVSCDALQQTIVSVGIPLAPISLASACELHCVGNGGVLSGCAAVVGGNCICVGVGDLLGIKLPKLPALPGK